MENDHYSIRVMNRAELDYPVEWAAREGWNPGLYDADAYYSADPNGFLIGLLGEEPIASISVVKYSESFGFLGFYIVRPEFRGYGYGFQIWKAGLEYLEGCCVGLDGVVDQQDNYKKSGFELAHRNIRYEGIGGGEALNDPSLIDLTQIPHEQVRDYERPFFPADRSAFLNKWIYQAESVALGYLKEGDLAGYGVLRKCQSGYKIGPLFANSPTRAEILFGALKSRAPEGSPFFLDIPEPNLAAIKLVDNHQMSPCFETARMYSGPAPDLPLDRIFGITSFEIG